MVCINLDENIAAIISANVKVAAAQQSEAGRTPRDGAWKVGVWQPGVAA
jgi:hypothetical protein